LFGTSHIICVNPKKRILLKHIRDMHGERKKRTILESTTKDVSYPPFCGIQAQEKKEETNINKKNCAHTSK